MKENTIYVSEKKQNPRLLEWELTKHIWNTLILNPICMSTKSATYTYKWLVIHLRDKHAFPVQNPKSDTKSYKAAIIFYLASPWNLYSYYMHFNICVE